MHMYIMPTQVYIQIYSRFLFEIKPFKIIVDLYIMVGSKKRPYRYIASFSQW